MNTYYYVAPPIQYFEEVKREAMKLWYEVDTDNDKYGYATEKVNRIKDLSNVSDNFMTMLAMFDQDNLRTLKSRLSDGTLHEISKRLTY